MTAGSTIVRRSTVGLRPLIMALLLGGLATAPGGAQGQSDKPPPPIVGVVVNIAQISQDFFVHLDLDGDDQGDQWAKLAGTIQDVQGNPLTPKDIALGTRLKLMDYKPNDAGFLEALKVIVLPPPDDEGGGGSGEDGSPGQGKLDDDDNN